MGASVCEAGASVDQGAIDVSRSEQGAIDVARVKRIKDALTAGMNPSVVATAEGLPYMVVYRIATGQTWKSVRTTAAKPGRLIPERQTKLTKEIRDKVYASKRATGRTNIRIAKAMGLSETMVARAVADGRALLAARVQRLLLTSGEHEVAMTRYGLTLDEVESLVAWAHEHDLPDHLQAEFAAEE